MVRYSAIKFKGEDVPEVVKSPAMLIIALVAFLLLITLVFELLFGIKIGRAVCKFTGGLISSAAGYGMGSILSGVTNIGIESACNMMPF
jgi:hypothetical protein